jgi:hypothetical protein
MKLAVMAMTIAAAQISGAAAQEAVPDLRGTWTGKGRVVVFGSHANNPGALTPNDPPRTREIETTHTVEGQDGRVAWGRSSSVSVNNKEPFAWAIASDNKSIVGADVDGYFRITLLGPDRIEKCYVHNGTGPSKTIVATCYDMNRVKR